MTDIKLGDSINVSLNGDSPKDSSGNYYAEYNITGLDDFRQLSLKLQSNSSSGSDSILNLFNTDTGARLQSSISLASNGIKDFLAFSTFPGANYTIRVAGGLGDYTLQTVDEGKGVAIVSADQIDLYGVGTVSSSGKYVPFTLVVPSREFTELALAPDNQLYGIRPLPGAGTYLSKLDPNIGDVIQVNFIREVAGGRFLADGTFNALEFSADNKLYAIDSTTAGDKLYQLDSNTAVATLVGNLPNGFVSSGDLAYNAASKSFYATSVDTKTSDALWQIPIADPTKATKIGQIGFTGVDALDFENGQLIGYTSKLNPATNRNAANKLVISTTNGVGTIVGQPLSVQGISPAAIFFPNVTSVTGAATILTSDPTTADTSANRVVTGTSDDDNIVNRTRNSTIFGDGGRDFINSSIPTGSNRLYGGDGNDTLFAGVGDRLFGEAGDDYLSAYSGQGKNRLYGGAGNDELIAGNTGDFLSGGDGEDTLYAGYDRTTLYGGAGADKFYLAYPRYGTNYFYLSEGSTTTNTVEDFEVGIDKLSILGLSGVTDFSKVTLLQQGSDTLVKAGGKDLAVLTGIQSSTITANSFGFI